MTPLEFLFNVTIILTVMAIAAVLEILLPMFADKPWRRQRRMANLGLTALSFMHHSREVGETNSNYANLLTIYDRVLGTYTPSARAVSVVYGLDDAAEMGQASFSGLLTMPFHGRAVDSASDEAAAAPLVASAFRRKL